MPRILRQLVAKINKPDVWLAERREEPRRFQRKRQKTLFRPVPAVSWSPLGRTRSIILDEQNPLVHKKAYIRHKTLPPILREPATRTAREGEYDRPRTMTAQERTWWSSPYLRMLASPIRSCFMTHRHLPRDFMIRLAPFRMLSPRITQATRTVFFPDGLEHPSFRRNRSGQAHYIVCWKAAVEQLAERDTCKRYAKNATPSPSITSHIGHLLRLRVLQEFEILAEELQKRPRGVEDSPILRRLTRAEFKAIKATGIIPYPQAVAILVVPPLNRDTTTKKRPEPAALLDNAPPKDIDITPSKSSGLPLSELLPTGCSVDDDDKSDIDDLVPLQPQYKVPLYNGVVLFPIRSQRAAFHALLCRLLGIERRARWRQHGRPPQSSSDILNDQEKWAQDKKGSHAFLLCSNSNSVLRADSVGAAISLMRVRMWEGAGWIEGTDQRGGWLWKAYRRRSDGTISI